MTDSTPSTHETPCRCEALSVAPSTDTCPSTERTLDADDVVRCPNDAVGKFRIDPDAGGRVSAWLCADHRRTYTAHIVEEIAVV